MSSEHPHSSAGSPRITGLVPMLHVADVQRSADFYRLLGFAIGHAMPEDPPYGWAWLYTPHAADWKRGANLMVTCSARPIEKDAQDVLFYLYVEDLPATRAALIAAGVAAGEIAYPEYLPRGEFRTEDPDGYTLMLAQSAADTP